MKKSNLYGISILVFLLLALMVGVVAADNTTVARRPVVAFPGDNGVEPGPGAYATLKRFDDGAQFNIHTSNLFPGETYTVWWVIFNDPQSCDAGCGDDDFKADPRRGDPSILYATGKVIPNNANGAANFQARLGEEGPPGQILFGDGLTNPAGAEIHLAIQGHGQPSTDEATLYEQTNRFKGGWGNPPCDTCANQQAVVFQP